MSNENKALITLSDTDIGLGLAALGRPEYINIRHAVEKDKSEDFYYKNALAVMDFAYTNGIRYFDTAPSYGKGEKFLNHWNKERKYKDLKLSTKWGYTYVANWEIGFQGKHEIKEHSIHKLREQWDYSRQLLPELKLYQIHSATFESGVFENEEVLQELYSIKKHTGVKIGASTSGTRQTDLLNYAKNIRVEGELLFDSFQVTYNILETHTDAVLKELLRSGRMIIIKEGLANGRVFRNDLYAHYDGLYSEMERLAKKYKVGVDAIALRFVMDNLNPSVILSGASSELQLKQNLLVRNFKLNKDELISLKNHSIDVEAYWKERNEMNWN